MSCFIFLVYFSFVNEKSSFGDRFQFFHIFRFSCCGQFSSSHVREVLGDSMTFTVSVGFRDFFLVFLGVQAIFCQFEENLAHFPSFSGVFSQARRMNPPPPDLGFNNTTSIRVRYNASQQCASSAEGTQQQGTFIVIRRIRGGSVLITACNVYLGYYSNVPQNKNSRTKMVIPGHWTDTAIRFTCTAMQPHFFRYSQRNPKVVW